MSASDATVALQSFVAFGYLLKYLRRRARLTQRELSIAVGYSETHISRLEQNQRPPELAALAALFIPALNLEDEPEVVARLMELAAAARGESLPPTGSLTVIQSVTHEITETIETLEDISPNNLPLQLTSFIGREAEIAEIKHLLIPGGYPPGEAARAPHSEVRLVTLTGAGGSGKTRLALQVAAEALAAFPDGVWFVDLAPLADSVLVPQTIASVLDVQATQSDSVLAALMHYTRDKTLLLLLDNCEHLIEACASLADTLLHAGPYLKVLATSRETLELAGETVYQVPSLSTPDPHHLLPVETLAQYEAVTLFVERAGMAWPAFTLTPNNSPIIAQVCHHLDGIPLAIELAAARVKLLRVEEIAARLADRFGLLTGGSRTARPRHQTLRALIDWSWDLLPEPERASLRRLSVFAGGWTLAAAETVCDLRFEAEPEQIENRKSEIVNVLDLLTHLVNKSLVVGERKQGAAARYRLLETIRQYAAEKLSASGEEQVVRNRHLAFFLELAEQAEPELRGREQLVWLSRLDEEYDNLRAALSWSLEQDNAEAALHLAGALFQFWHIRGFASEGRRWLEAALAMEGKAEALKRSPWRAKALLGNGVLAHLQGDYPTAQASLEESLSIYRELGDKSGIGYVLHRLAAIPYWQGDNVATRVLYEQSLSLLQAEGDAWGVGNCLYGLARLALKQGDFKAANSLFEESVTILRQVGDRRSLTRPLEYWSWEVWTQGDLATGRSLLEESLSLYRELGAKSGLAHTLGWLGMMEMHHGNIAASYSLEEEALAIGRELGSKQDIAWSFTRLGALARRQGDLAQARAYCEEGIELFREINDSVGIGWMLSLLGHVIYYEGAYNQAAALLKEGLALYEQTDNKIFIIFTLLWLGDVVRLQGDYDQAAAYYRRSLKLHRKRGARIEVADRLEGLAKVAGRQGQPERAGRLFGAAQALREQLGTPLPPVEYVDYEDNLAAVRTALGEGGLAAAWAEGQAMTIEQVTGYALADSGDIE